MRATPRHKAECSGPSGRKEVKEVAPDYLRLAQEGTGPLCERSDLQAINFALSNKRRLGGSLSDAHLNVTRLWELLPTEGLTLPSTWNTTAASQQHRAPAPSPGRGGTSVNTPPAPPTDDCLASKQVARSLVRGSTCPRSPNYPHLPTQRSCFPLLSLPQKASGRPWNRG